MSNQVIVHKDRYNTLQVNLGYDISDETFTSEIRSEPTVHSTLIATWDVSFLSDGSDGKLLLVINSEVASQITANSGYMDLKRVGTDQEPVSVFDEPLEVSFRGVVTA